MAERFSGDWTVEDVGHYDGLWIMHQFIIEGSRASDGEYFFDPTNAPVSVSGPSWFIRSEWLSSEIGGMRATPMPLRRTGAAYPLEGGLVVFLKPYNEFGDIQIGKIVLRCSNVDPKLNPWHPFANTYDFTLPERSDLPGILPAG